jgi:hypothetical protein
MALGGVRSSRPAPDGVLGDHGFQIVRGENVYCHVISAAACTRAAYLRTMAMCFRLIAASLVSSQTSICGGHTSYPGRSTQHLGTINIGPRTRTCHPRAEPCMPLQPSSASWQPTNAIETSVLQWPHSTFRAKGGTTNMSNGSRRKQLQPTVSVWSVCKTSLTFCMTAWHAA